MALWNILRRPQNSRQIDVLSTPTFDKKYKTVISFPTTQKDTEKMMWINDNASSRSVDVKFVDNMVYMAFEDDSDALIFRIKFL